MDPMPATNLIPRETVPPQRTHQQARLLPSSSRAVLTEPECDGALDLNGVYRDFVVDPSTRLADGSSGLRPVDVELYFCKRCGRVVVICEGRFLNEYYQSARLTIAYGEEL